MNLRYLSLSLYLIPRFIHDDAVTRKRSGAAGREWGGNFPVVIMICVLVPSGLLQHKQRTKQINVIDSIVLFASKMLSILLKRFLSLQRR